MEGRGPRSCCEIERMALSKCEVYTEKKLQEIRPRSASGVLRCLESRIGDRTAQERARVSFNFAANREFWCAVCLLYSYVGLAYVAALTLGRVGRNKVVRKRVDVTRISDPCLIDFIGNLLMVTN